MNTYRPFIIYFIIFSYSCSFSSRKCSKPLSFCVAWRFINVGLCWVSSYWVLSGVMFYQHQFCHLYVGLPLNGMPCQYNRLHLPALHGFIFRIIPLSVSILSPEAFSVTIIWICICYAFAILWLSVISIHPVLVSIFPLFGVLSIVLVHLFIWMDSWAASRPSKYTYISINGFFSWISADIHAARVFLFVSAYASCMFISRQSLLFWLL